MVGHGANARDHAENSSVVGQLALQISAAESFGSVLSPVGQPTT